HTRKEAPAWFGLWTLWCTCRRLCVGLTHNLPPCVRTLLSTTTSAHKHRSALLLELVGQVKFCKAVRPRHASVVLLHRDPVPVRLDATRVPGYDHTPLHDDVVRLEQPLTVPPVLLGVGMV